MPETTGFQAEIACHLWGGKKSDPSDSQAEGRGFVESKLDV